MQTKLDEDPNLPFRDLIWSQTGMAMFLNDHVLPVAWPDRKAATIAIERIRYKPGRKCEALYRLEFRDRPEESASRILLTVAKSGASARKLEEAQRCHYSGRAAPRLGRPRLTAVFLPEFGCLIELFPYDWRLTSLAQILLELDLAPRLAEAVSCRDDLSNPVIKVEVLQYRPHACCVVEISVGSQDGKHQRKFIGKVYRDAETAKDVLRKQRSLQFQALDHGLVIPRPLEVVEDLNLLIMERISGSSIAQLQSAATSERSYDCSVRATAMAIATLHGLKLEGGEVRTLRTQWAHCAKRVNRIHLVAPELSRKMESMLNRIDALIRQLNVTVLRTIHGDFKWSHLLLREGEVGILDVDKACLGDPAFEVGSIMAAYCRDARSSGDDRQRRLAGEFLAAYQESAPDCDGLAERARISQALILMNFASHLVTRFPNKYESPSQSWRLALLEDAEACLDSIDGASG